MNYNLRENGRRWLCRTVHYTTSIIIITIPESHTGQEEDVLLYYYPSHRNHIESLTGRHRRRNTSTSATVRIALAATVRDHIDI